MTDAGSLGVYLKDRRAKLDPATFGFPLKRRRTPGLRREEVAQRANVSATWYTWLEQGRGGAPSANVLDRIAGAMMLTDVEREHLFLLGLGRPPEVRYHAPEGVTPRLQRVLDTLDHSPAFVRTATWDVIAWNAAAAAVLTDYGALAAGQRNVLRMMFRDSRVRAAQSDWRSVARYVVASFRADVARAGAARDVQSLVDELCATSPEFAAMWRDNDVQGHGDGLKVLHHPIAGRLSMEFSGFAVDGRPFQSPFAKPPGKGLSSSTVNVLWGFANLVIAYGLILRVGQFDLRAMDQVASLGLGLLLMSVMAARTFGRFHGGNSPAGG